MIKLKSVRMSDGGYSYYYWTIVDEKGEVIWRDKISNSYSDRHAARRVVAETTLTTLLMGPATVLFRED